MYNDPQDATSVRTPTISSNIYSPSHTTTGIQIQPSETAVHQIIEKEDSLKEEDHQLFEMSTYPDNQPQARENITSPMMENDNNVKEEESSPKIGNEMIKEDDQLVQETCFTLSSIMASELKKGGGYLVAPKTPDNTFLDAMGDEDSPLHEKCFYMQAALNFLNKKRIIKYPF